VRSITANGQLSSSNTDTNSINNNASLAQAVQIGFRATTRKGLTKPVP
jgi:hypothetical protein